MAAFKKFKNEVRDYSEVDVKDLPRFYNEILKRNIFTKADVVEFNKAIRESTNPASASESMNRVKKRLEPRPIEEIREFRGLLNKFNDLFKYLDNLLRITDQELRDFATFTNYLARYIDPIGKGGKLDEELKKVFLTTHKIRLEKPDTAPHADRPVSAKEKRVPQYATIPEVIDAINTRFEIALGDNDRYIMQKYVQEIVKDQEIITDIQANKRQDLWKLYTTTLASKLKDRAIRFFLDHNPAKLTQYLDTGVLDSLNEEAFRFATQQTN